MIIFGICSKPRQTAESWEQQTSDKISPQLMKKESEKVIIAQE